MVNAADLKSVRPRLLLVQVQPSALDFERPKKENDMTKICF
jgi:hypothetical protein